MFGVDVTGRINKRRGKGMGVVGGVGWNGVGSGKVGVGVGGVKNNLCIHVSLLF